MQAKAQSPGHITGFFVIYPNGSTGAGINIEGGMKTTVAKTEAGKDYFFMKGKKALAGTKTKLIVSEKVVQLFRKKTGEREKVLVVHQTRFPIGYGLGISGAGALSLTICLNKLFMTGLAKQEVLEIAKQAEIECGTGLGDVVAEQFSVVMMGHKPYPSRAITKIKAKEKFVALGFFKPITTKKIIRSAAWKRKINKSGLECMALLGRKKTMGSFTRLCRKFTVESGLATGQILHVMANMPNASMSMLGETIFCPTNRPKKTIALLKKYCGHTMVCRVAAKGAGLL